MPPKPQNRDAFELFQSHFDPACGGLNPAHERVQPARKLALSPEGIDWDRFEAVFAGGYSPDMGAPAKATRLMVGLQYLKYTFDESDESVVDRWVENPYWQYFCGYTHLQHRCPIHPTSMTRWRKRVGADRLVELLLETIALAKREGQVSKRDLERPPTADHRAREEHHLPHGFQAAVQGASKTCRRGPVPGHRATPIVPAGGQDRGGESQSLRPCSAVPTHAAFSAQAPYLSGAADSRSAKGGPQGEPSR